MLSEILKLLFVGLVSGLFSAHVAFRGHQKKRFWELQVEAYQEVINALSDLHFYFSSHYNSHLLREEMGDEHRKRLSAARDSGYPKLRRAADAGAFLFSEEVNQTLLEFINVYETRQDTYDDHLDANLHQVSVCLKTVVAASKTDLKLKWRLWE